VFGWIFEFLVPALGGPYQIHLITAKGRELVAWPMQAPSAARSTRRRWIASSKNGIAYNRFHTTAMCFAHPVRALMRRKKTDK
jgi:hypothetical protein